MPISTALIYNSRNFIHNYECKYIIYLYLKIVKH
nr:MAG TPA: hypothetical protein [Caudoviricetes sp.]DAW00146.1 MAG TPA: hypothetical protein [Caudoviricetes sp.]